MAHRSPRDEVLDLLARTFEDRRLTRAERKEIRRHLAEAPPDERRRAYYAHRVRPFRGISKHHLAACIAVFEWAHNVKAVTTERVQTMSRLHL